MLEGGVAAGAFGGGACTGSPAGTSRVGIGGKWGGAFAFATPGGGGWGMVERTL